jgi:hypothetical protein
VAVGVAVDERAVGVLVRMHVGLVGVGLAKCWHCSNVATGAVGSASRQRHETSVLMTPTAAQVRTIGIMPTR